MASKKTVQEIPEHLRRFVFHQDPSLYTPCDHAAWRYIMKVSRAYFKDHAHQKYLDGLKQTGISTDRIPLIEEMDECLRELGWRAVGVVGFIPPAAFMEFQSLGILPIACDMRTLEHLHYTPAPDIVHEAAGHAPIIADQEYSRYLRNYGEVARRAISTDRDMEVYLAIRNLSDTKEDPASTDEDVKNAQDRLDEAVKNNTYISEAAYLARMNWWTVEYGLVGKLEAPLIFGAGLLSSVGESYECLKPKVKKIPFSLDCINTNYDITRPQPQLFVIQDFKQLTEVLEQFAETMAFKKGGCEGLIKAKEAKSITTSQLNTGLQISGVLSRFDTFDGNPSFLKFDGPSQLSFDDEQINGHGADFHEHGYSSPIGTLRDGRALEDLSIKDLEGLGFIGTDRGRLQYKSGVELTGRLKNIRSQDDKNLLLTFEDCLVKKGDETLFDPSWGVFDLACGTQVNSVFGGPADRAAYLDAVDRVEKKPNIQKTNLTSENRLLNELYSKVRQCRENLNGGKQGDAGEVLDRVFNEYSGSNYDEDWLLGVELLEIDQTFQVGLKCVPKVEARLRALSQRDPVKKTLIDRGLAAI